MGRFLADLAASEPARFGLLVGIGGTVLAVVAWAAIRSAGGRSGPAPWGGAVMVLSTLALMWRYNRVPTGLVVGVVLLIVGAMLGRRLWELMVASLPGAAAVVYWGEAGRAIPEPMLVIAIAAAAALVVDFDRAYRASGAGPALLFLSTVGVLVTVPDTELAMGLAAVSLPIGVAGWPLRMVALGPAAAAAVAILAHLAVVAGNSRPGAAVGVLGALGLMLAEPVGRWLGRRTPSALQELAAGGLGGVFLLGSVHAVLVLGITRFAGLRRELLTAAIFAIPFLLVGAILGAAPGRPASPEPGRIETIHS